MDKKLKQALSQSFTPPPARQTEQFASSICYPKASFRELLVSQIGFIRKRVWILFMLSVGFAFFYTQFVSIPQHIIAGISAILPLLSLCVIAEIYKSTAYNMEELELASKCNLLKITLMRMGILGTVSFISLVFFVIIAGKSDVGMLRSTIYISVPYLLTSYLSLVLVSKIHSREAMYICAAISGVVSAFMVLASNIYQCIYSADFTFIWIMLLALLIGLLFYSLIRFIKSQEELQWSLA